MIYLNAAFDPNKRYLTGLGSHHRGLRGLPRRGLGIYDPNHRYLTGMMGFDPNKRYLTSFGCDCNKSLGDNGDDGGDSEFNALISPGGGGDIYQTSTAISPVVTDSSSPAYASTDPYEATLAPGSVQLSTTPSGPVYGASAPNTAYPAGSYPNISAPSPTSVALPGGATAYAAGSYPAGAINVAVPSSASTSTNLGVALQQYGPYAIGGLLAIAVLSSVGGKKKKRR